MSERIRIEKKSFERPPRPERVRPGRKSDKLSLLADATTKAGKGGNQRLRDVPRAAKNGGGVRSMPVVDSGTSLPLGESDYCVSPAGVERATEKLARRFEVGERVELHGVGLRVAAIDGLKLMLEAGVSRGRVGAVLEPAQRPGQNEDIDGKQDADGEE